MVTWWRAERGRTRSVNDIISVGTFHNRVSSQNRSLERSLMNNLVLCQQNEKIKGEIVKDSRSERKRDFH